MTSNDVKQQENTQILLPMNSPHLSCFYRNFLLAPLKPG